MKTIRSLMTLAGLSLALTAFAAAGASAQGFTMGNVGGAFTLPFETHWGAVTLPAGEYTLSYGQAFKGGTYIVAVTSKADGTTRMAIVNANSDASTKKDALVCIRQGDALVVRTLEMPELGTAAQFAMPHGAKLVARNRNHKGYTQLAEVPMLLERISVTQNAR